MDNLIAASYHTSEERLVRFRLDGSAIEKRMAQVVEVLQVKINDGLPEGVLRGVLGYLKVLLLNVVPSDGGTTIGADGTNQILVRLDLGDGDAIERLITALRAGEVDGIHRAISVPNTTTNQAQ